MTSDPIADFVEDYAERCAEKGQRAISAATLRPILEDFVLAEPWLNDDPTRLAVALRSLRRVAENALGAPQLIDVVEREATALSAKLERQHHANEIMREHLTMLSDQLRRLRA